MQIRKKTWGDRLYIWWVYAVALGKVSEYEVVTFQPIMEVT